MKYGYGRCSTNETKQDITRQERELKEHGAELVILEFEHGDAAHKKELEKLLDTVRAGDEIITLEVSRLARSTKQLCDIIELAERKQIKLVIANSITVDCTDGNMDAMTKAFLQIAGVFAELELSMIRSRVKSGMENARAKGKAIGRPRTARESIPEAFYKYLPLYQAQKINKTDFANISGLSRPSVNKYLSVIGE
ncbi:MAG: recombinase family protein [Clostridia bacterium]|nr:recombinase family protein [Clostridia bacterium]